MVKSNDWLLPFQEHTRKLRLLNYVLYGTYCLVITGLSYMFLAATIWLSRM